MSIFGSPVFDGVGGFNSGSYTSGPIDVAADSLIVVLVVGNESVFPITSVDDTAGNSYIPAGSVQTDGNSFQYQWYYCLSADANAANEVTATFTGSGNEGLLAVWVTPITGGTPALDVLITLGDISGTGAHSTGTFNTAGTDEIGFCGLFDGDGASGSTPWSIAPGSIDDGNFAGTRGAAFHATWSSPQSGINFTATNTTGASGGITAIAFQAAASGGAISCSILGAGALSAQTGAFNLESAMFGAASLVGSLFGVGHLAAVLDGSGSVSAEVIGLSEVSAGLAGDGSLAGTLAGAGELLAALAGDGSLIGTISTPYALNSNMDGRGSVVAFPTIPPARVYFPPNNPGNNSNQPPYVLRDFGVSLQRPAYLATSQNTTQLFYQTTYIPNVNAGSVLPPSWSTPGTPNNQGYQGRVQAPGQLLVFPDNLRLSGKVYTVVAQGMVFIPISAVNPTFNLVMSQNYFQFGQPQVVNTLFTLISPVSMVPGTMNGFTLIATLAGNGVGTAVLSCAGRLWIGGDQYFGSGYSINPPQTTSGKSRPSYHREPIGQLSLGVQFGGSVSGSDLYQAFLSKFQLFDRVGTF